MAANYGKAFEQLFRRDVLTTVPGIFVYRLPDLQSGYFGQSANPCDFLVYKKPNFYMIELKSIKGNTFPLSNLRLYRKLVLVKSVDGLNIGIVIWFRDHDKIIYLTIKEISKMIKDGKKSVNITTLDSDGYNYILIPTKKKRIFLVGDYNILFNLEYEK